MNQSSSVRAVACALVIALAAGIAASPASAKLPVKTGAYFQQVGKKTGYIITDKGKITGVSASLVFKKNGKACTPDGLSTYDGVTGLYFAPKRPAASNSKNRFSFNGTRQSAYPKLKTSVAGRFVSANKATFTIKASQGNCKASLTLKNARYTAGG